MLLFVPSSYTPIITLIPLTSKIHQWSHISLLPLRYTNNYTHNSYLWDTPVITHIPLTSEIHQWSPLYLLPLRYTNDHTYPSYLWDTPMITPMSLTSEIHQWSPFLPLRYTNDHTYPSYLWDTPMITPPPYLWDTALEPCIHLDPRSDPNLRDIYATDVHVASQVEPDRVSLGLSC